MSTIALCAAYVCLYNSSFWRALHVPCWFNWWIFSYQIPSINKLLVSSPSCRDNAISYMKTNIAWHVECVLRHCVYDANVHVINWDVVIFVVCYWFVKTLAALPRHALATHTHWARRQRRHTQIYAQSCRQLSPQLSPNAFLRVSILSNATSDMNWTTCGQQVQWWFHYVNTRVLCK